MSPVRYCHAELPSVAFSSYEHLSFQGSRWEGKTSQSRGKGLQIEIEWLSSSAHCIGNGPVKVVDLEEGHCVEKPAPEELLLSAGGLLLKQKSTLLCLRTRVAPPPPPAAGVSIRSDVWCPVQATVCSSGTGGRLLDLGHCKQFPNGSMGIPPRVCDLQSRARNPDGQSFVPQSVIDS